MKHKGGMGRNKNKCLTYKDRSVRRFNKIKKLEKHLKKKGKRNADGVRPLINNEDLVALKALKLITT